MRNRMRIGGGVVSLSLAVGCIIGMGNSARADVFNLPSGQTSLQFVTVGDPGNAPDTTGFGAVPYTYQIGTYDITVAQYCDMLNAVAQTDTYGVYNASMNPGNSPASCGIVQGGGSGSFTYTYAASRANDPVNAVSWGDAARFCNWLENGQPTTGVENSTTTEDGSYTLNGAHTIQAYQSVTRSTSAIYVIPTENEWYKAAYYDPTLNGGAGGYWLFPTKSNTPPSNVISRTGQNNANFTDPVLGLTDAINILTPVGAFSGTTSPFGAFDMGGDVAEWNEAIIAGGRGVRGGSYASLSSDLESGTRLSEPAPEQGSDTGFRVAEVPEPGSIRLIVCAAGGMLTRRRRRRPNSGFVA